MNNSNRLNRTGSKVYGNTMVECMSSGVKIMTWPQGMICGNDIHLPDDEDEDDVSTSTNNRCVILLLTHLRKGPCLVDWPFVRVV